MAPIVHGLENEWKDSVDFIYLDIADPANTGARARFGFRATPHFFFLTTDGRIVAQVQGVVRRDSLQALLRSIVREIK